MCDEFHFTSRSLFLHTMSYVYKLFMVKCIKVIFLGLLIFAVYPSSGQVNLNKGLVAYYPFNGSFNDASGNGNDGTPMNGAAFGADQWGNANNAAFFDGIDDYVSIPASPLLTARKHFSLAFRFKTNNGRYQMVLSKGDYLPDITGPDNIQYHVGIFGTSVVGNPALYFATTHNGNCTRNTASASAVHHALADTPSSINEWHCVVMVFDSGVKKVYINGVLRNQSTVTGHAMNSSPDTCVNGPLKLGVWWSNDPLYFSGYLDELRIWDRTLNSQEIDSLCNVTTINPPDSIDCSLVDSQVVATPADIKVCLGDKIQLNAHGSKTYQWTPSSGLDNPNIAAPVATVQGDVRYIVTGIDAAGCKSADTINIHFRPLPEVDATAEGIGSKCADKSILLKATGGIVQSYYWTPVTYVENPNNSTTYTKPLMTTLYTITVIDANGCKGIDTVTATVSDETVVIMPDAFSPNGDQRNDLIHPMIFCDFTLEEYHIYDRWGREVFLSNSSNGGWDGKRNGQPADIGSYHYIISGKRTSNGERVMTKGNFVLIR